MKWLAVVGSRYVTPEMRRDIKRYVTQKVADGYGIVSGGGTGTDTYAVRMALEAGIDISRVKLFLPGSVEKYSDELRRRALEGKCKSDDAEETIRQLHSLASNTLDILFYPGDIETIDARAFHARNRRIVSCADELVAFRLGQSKGTTYSIERARQKGIPVQIFEY